MMKSFPHDRICIICIKLRKNSNSQLHFKPDIVHVSFIGFLIIICRRNGRALCKRQGETESRKYDVREISKSK